MEESSWKGGNSIEGSIVPGFDPGRLGSRNLTLGLALSTRFI